MSKFIKHMNNATVNLELVTSITGNLDKLKIYFNFDAMNSEEFNDIEWSVNTEHSFHNIMQHIDILEL